VRLVIYFRQISKMLWRKYKM